MHFFGSGCWLSKPFWLAIGGSWTGPMGVAGKREYIDLDTKESHGDQSHETSWSPNLYKFVFDQSLPLTMGCVFWLQCSRWLLYMLTCSVLEGAHIFSPDVRERMWLSMAFTKLSAAVFFTPGGWPGFCPLPSALCWHVSWRTKQVLNGSAQLSWSLGKDGKGDPGNSWSQTWQEWKSRTQLAVRFLLDDHSLRSTKTWCQGESPSLHDSYELLVRFQLRWS